ncbi:hypothetical protein ACFT2C_06020 [Promicromonospora sp. NPDC057138]|uniref:hypothetical protein n=1 Tax=Promicromonospora sp. NPDC057138 TaxID=3346031 RepID=UPI0036283B77
MSMSRREWIDLPALARRAVEARIGTVTRAETAGAGINSAIATTLHTDGGRVFLKGIALDHVQVDEQQREVEINPYVTDVAPRLLWQIGTAGWSLLGYEYVDGRRADYRPGSLDFPLLADAVRRLHKIPCPDVPQMLRLEKRLADFDGDGVDVSLFAGNDIMHTDWGKDNVLIGDNTVHVVDWAWPTRGPAWADIATLAVRLVEAGHTPSAADEWARSEFPAWATAPERAVCHFAEAYLRLWNHILDEDPQPWNALMVDAARAWADHLNGASRQTVR